MNRHVRETHLKSNNESDKECSTKGKKKIQCLSCDKFLSNKTRLKHHMLTHNRKNAFKCDICDKVMARNSNLTAHKKKYCSGNRLIEEYFEEDTKDEIKNENMTEFNGFNVEEYFEEDTMYKG